MLREQEEMTQDKKEKTRIVTRIAVGAFTLCVAVLLAGCGSPQKKVARQMEQLRHQWQTNLQHQATLPERVLDWSSAVAIMQENSLKLRQARNEVTNSYESVRQIFKDLIPTLNLRSGVSKRIHELGDITPDDVTLSADSFFNVPGLVNFGARLYAAQLYYLRAKAAYQLAEREQMIELYRLFFSAEDLHDQAARLQMQQAIAQAMQQVDEFSGRLKLTELETRELAYAREAKSLQDRASELLGTRDYQWIFATNGLPNLRYHEVPLVLSDTNRVAQLQMKLLAIELEAARAQLMGLKLRYWPELNIFVSGPPIYSRQFGRDRFWDADAVRVSADLFWTIDTRGNLTRALRQTKRQQELQKARYRQESLAMMDRLLFTQGLAGTIQSNLMRVEAQLAALLAIPPAQNYTAFEKYAFDYASLTQQQLQLKRELSELNALFWFVDEQAWGGQNTALPQS
jgi:hypothetical protein